MIRAVILLLSLVVAVPVLAAGVVWRSPNSGVLPTPMIETPMPPMPPEAPAGFVLTIVGEVSVAASAALDLHPVVSGASGPIVSYLLFGRLPTGATFDPDSGKISGRALIAGTYTVWVSAADSSGAAVTAEVVIVVT